MCTSCSRSAPCTSSHLVLTRLSSSTTGRCLAVPFPDCTPLACACCRRGRPILLPAERPWGRFTFQPGLTSQWLAWRLNSTAAPPIQLTKCPQTFPANWRRDVQRVHGSWFMVHGAWCTVHGARFTVHGSRFMVYGLGFGLWFMVQVLVYGLGVGLWFSCWHRGL
ncbi:uncharacterized protein K444DRAFT_96063 [Hyaloscypha bicolor E]|uniref:Uncharacterized protein n=1 Tax=Hyaloscypha bicolor E TaxID=1095630 RepID=A0A2J6SWC0_9HELO|nr:uncharacterized protein K444DRAFT_96063 [Hyaloscypha bicolor E]PMD55051.1 hypothetical protein K444DRAFT_96063 [Hyaloscypha bicolor E]